VINFIRGLSSIPGAYTKFRDKRLKIYKARNPNIEPPGDFSPGQVMPDKHKLLVAVAGGAVEILELQPEGKGRMTGEQFLRGYHPDRNDILGAKV
jgi:methionyl-tRNA formyltransferase